MHIGTARLSDLRLPNLDSQNIQVSQVGASNCRNYSGSENKFELQDGTIAMT